MNIFNSNDELFLLLILINGGVIIQNIEFKNKGILVAIYQEPYQTQTCSPCDK